MSRFGPETIWEAYLGLHRYMDGRASVGPLAVPSRIPARPSTETHTRAVREIGAVLESCWDRMPLMASEGYYAYLYLFCQLLRCSLPYGPYQDGAGRWRQLAWFPIHTLRGRDDAAERAWNAWYYRNVQSLKPHPDEAQLQKSYPWIPRAEERSAILAILQARTLSTLVHDGIPVDRALNTYDATGRPNSNGPATWHPWLVLAQPCMSPLVYDDPRWLHVRHAISQMFKQPAQWDSWYANLEKLNVTGQGFIVAALDQYMRSLPIRQQRTWRKLRTKWKQHAG